MFLKLLEQSVLYENIITSFKLFAELLADSEKTEGVFLSDIDAMSDQESGYIKLNTLKHYNVSQFAFCQ